MTTIEIDLPDALAKEAANAGLLVPERIALILREQLRVERVERLKTVRHSLAAAPLPPMSAARDQRRNRRLPPRAAACVWFLTQILRYRGCCGVGHQRG